MFSLADSYIQLDHLYQTGVIQRYPCVSTCLETLPEVELSVYIFFIKQSLNILFLFVFPPNNVCLCNSPEPPGSIIDQSGLKLIDICLPLPLKCWD